MCDTLFVNVASLMEGQAQYIMPNVNGSNITIAYPDEDEFKFLLGDLICGFIYQLYGHLNTVQAGYEHGDYVIP